MSRTADVMIDVKERKLLTEFFSVGGIISSLLALGLVSIFERLKAGASKVNLPGVGGVPVIP